MSGLKEKITSGAVWLFFAKFGIFFINFAGSVVLARILSPSTFGVVVICNSFVGLVSMITNIGVRPSILQLDDNEDSYTIKISNIFWFNFILTFAVALIICILFPFFGNFKDIPYYLIVLIVTGWIFDNISLPARAVLHKKHLYKYISLLRLTVPFLSMIFAIYMARNGLGALSLVLPQMLFLMIASFVALKLSKIRLSQCCFSIYEIRSTLNNMHWHVIHGFSDKGFKEIDKLLLGSFLGQATVGLYSRAYMLCSLFQQQIGQHLYTLTLPINSSNCSTIEQKSTAFRISFKLILYVISTLALISYFLIDDLILIVYGDQWILSAQIYKSLVLYAVFAPLYSILKSILVGHKLISYVAFVDTLKFLSLFLLIIVLIDTYTVFFVGYSVTFSSFIGVLLLTYKVIRLSLLKVTISYLLPVSYFIFLLTIALFECDLSTKLFMLLLLCILFLIIEKNELSYLLKKRKKNGSYL